MQLSEYIKSAKAELDKFEKEWIEDNMTNPKNYPNELDLSEWEDREIYYRFGILY